MVDCFDRIHLRLTEVVLRPLHALRDQPSPSSATIRLPGRGCQIELTVTKRSPEDEMGATPTYSWSARGTINTVDREWQCDKQFDTPDAACWNALDRVGVSVRSSTPVRPIPERLPWNVRRQKPPVQSR